MSWLVDELLAKSELDTYGGPERVQRLPRVWSSLLGAAPRR